MSLLTYKETRPWAKAIREAVLVRKMPPWFAAPRYGKFTNDRSLSREEIQTLVAWVDAGAPEGVPADLPAPRKFLDGWNIPEPDVARMDHRRSQPVLCRHLPSGKIPLAMKAPMAHYLGSLAFRRQQTATAGPPSGRES